MHRCVCKLVFADLEVSSHPGLTQMWQSTHNASHGFSAWITSKDERRGGEKKLRWKCWWLPQQVSFKVLAVHFGFSQARDG